MFYNKPSKIHGVGCFTSQSLNAGEIRAVSCWRTEELSEHSLQTDYGIYEFYAPFRHLNHSTDPNADIYETSNGFELRILKRVAADEEVTIDYGDDWE